MSILNPTAAGNGAANPWTGRVRCLGTCPPWWQTTAVLCVAEVQLQGSNGAPLFTVLLNVARSSKSGRLFASSPSTKRDDKWLATVTFDDTQLAQALHSAAIAGYEAAERAQLPTPTAAEGLPF